MLNELRSRADLVVEILRFEHHLKAGVEQFKAVALLKDTSQLHINEVWLEGRLHKYSYYWLTGTGQLIQGWDNVPHHPQLDTTPHHTHTPPDDVSESAVRMLDDVFKLIARRLG